MLLTPIIKQTLPNPKPLMTIMKKMPRKTKMVETTGRITQRFTPLSGLSCMIVAVLNVILSVLDYINM